MIPALLGIDRNPDTSRDEIDRRMINLLKEAARNKALVVREPQYEQQYERAVTPDPKRLAA